MLVLLKEISSQPPQQSMEHSRNSISTSGSMYTVNDMTPETVMSELNLFSKCKQTLPRAVNEDTWNSHDHNIYTLTFTGPTTSEWNLSNSHGVIYSNSAGSTSYVESPNVVLSSASSLKSEDQSDKSSSTLSSEPTYYIHQLFAGIRLLANTLTMYNCIILALHQRAVSSAM